MSVMHLSVCKFNIAVVIDEHPADVRVILKLALIFVSSCITKPATLPGRKDTQLLPEVG